MLNDGRIYVRSRPEIHLQAFDVVEAKGIANGTTPRTVQTRFSGQCLVALASLAKASGVGLLAATPAYVLYTLATGHAQASTG
jgi:hypothetical protein